MGSRQFDRQTVIDAMTNRKVIIIKGTDNTPIPVGGQNRISIYSPPFTISTMFNAVYTWDAADGATSGTKAWVVDVAIDGTGSTGKGMNKLIQNYNQLLSYDQGTFVGGSSAQNPSDLTAFRGQIANTVFDDTRALQLVFENNTNVVNTSLRSWWLFVVQEVVAR
jgi:hypothetical protein